METKLCPKCGLDKPLSEYHKSRNSKTGHTNKCKSCCKEYNILNASVIKAGQKRWKNKNKEELNAYHKNWRVRNPAYGRLSYHKHKENHAASTRLRKYNISKEEYDSLLVGQEGKCKICDRHYSEFRKRLAVDHDHDTGEFRGLLCAACNTGIGLLKESVEILRAAEKYLLFYKKDLGR